MNELMQSILARADEAQAANLSRFFKTGPGQYGEGDRFLGVKVPVVRAVVREHWRGTDFAQLEECLASPYHEVRLAGLLALVQQFHHAMRHSTPRPQSRSAKATQAVAGGVSPQQCVDFYLAHLPAVNNWDLVDLSCYEILGTWFLTHDTAPLYALAREGRTIWEQRIGMVSTMMFLRHGRLDDTYAIADILLHHPHDLIHKAVGWLLREAGKRDEARLRQYLSSRCRTMPRTMLRYAIERFAPAERQAWLRGQAG